MSGKALVIGNSDGIGLSLTRRLLEVGWEVAGVSRSESEIESESYSHVKVDVRSDDYSEQLGEAFKALDGEIDLCVYCVGVGEDLDLNDLRNEVAVFEVNLLGMIKTIEKVVPEMINRGQGHIIGLSSLADALSSKEAPSYDASKAGFSRYLEGLAFALKPKGVSVTNVRFGFVDTKMAKSPVRPFLMTPEKAVRHLMKCIRRKPIRYSAPFPMRIIVRLLGFLSWMKVRF